MPGTPGGNQPIFLSDFSDDATVIEWSSDDDQAYFFDDGEIRLADLGGVTSAGHVRIRDPETNANVQARVKGAPGARGRFIVTLPGLENRKIRRGYILRTRDYDSLPPIILKLILRGQPINL